VPRRHLDVVVRDARSLSDEQLRAELSRALELLDVEHSAASKNIIDTSSFEAPQLTVASNHG
jgi:hypothetical protein